MERFGPQLYESDTESDDDKKADKEKKKKGGSTTKAVKSLSSVLRLDSEGKGESWPSRPFKMNLALLEGKPTELLGGKSEKPRKQPEAKEESKKDDEWSGTAEEALKTQDGTVAGTEEWPKTPANAKENGKQDKPETYEFPKRELGPNEMGGELYFASDEPIKEHVILLHETRADETAMEAHAAADLPEEEPGHSPADGEAPTNEPESPTPGGGEVPPPEPPEHTAEGSDEPDEPDRPIPGAGEVPPSKPPEHTAEGSDEPEPERPIFRPGVFPAPGRPEPAQVYREYMQREAAVRQTEAERMVTQQQLEDEVYYASKYHQSRGLLTGLLVGGWYEHRKHKRREKKAAKEAKAKEKQLEAARRDYSFGLQEQERRQAELNARLNVAERRVTVAEQATTEQQRKAQEIEAMARAAAQPEQPVASAEQLMVPPEHRIELSAWLSAEVDKRTGRVVERPTFQYGHEYYRERAQETMPLHQRNAAAGAAALMAAANGQTPADGTALPPADLPSATMQGRPSQAGSQQAGGAQRKPSEPMASAALLWPWVIALVIIVICLAFVLH